MKSHLQNGKRNLKLCLGSEKMKGKDKKSKSRLSDFLRYRGREMTGRERNAFESELQRDPFFEEASEGLESVDPEQIRSDIRRMKAGLSARSGKRSSMSFYRVAASLLIILALGSLIVISTRKGANSDKGIAINRLLPETGRHTKSRY
ncbi:MAG: hypothetical protein MZV63_37110 [Marinilabiliales bacterium]|nr:hypothetical protein [Marinilabiliales bacterium]